MKKSNPGPALGAGSVSAAAIRKFLRAAQACGFDYSDLLDRAGVGGDLLDDNNRRISLNAMEELLIGLISRSGRSDFGLMSADFVDPSSYSVLGYVTLNCATLGQVLAMIKIYESIAAEMGDSSTVVDEGVAYQQWSCRFSQPLARRQAIDSVFGSWYRFALDFLKIDVRLLAVWFEFDAPSEPAEQALYESYFHCPVLFGKPFSAMLLDKAQLELPIKQGDPKLLAVLQGLAMERLAELGKNTSTTERVYNLLRMTLASEKPSSEKVAAELGMSSRTLQRKLGDEGASFQRVLDQLRLDMASYYLLNTAMTVDQISSQLGFNDQRSFHRGFKAWTGTTAREYRARQLRSEGLFE